MKISNVDKWIDFSGLGVRASVILIPIERIFFTRATNALAVRKTSEDLVVTIALLVASITTGKEVRVGEILSVYTTAGVLRTNIKITNYVTATGVVEFDVLTQDAVVISTDYITLPADEILEAGLPCVIDPQNNNKILMSAETAPTADNLHFQSADGSFLKFFF